MGWGISRRDGNARRPGTSDSHAVPCVSYAQIGAMAQAAKDAQGEAGSQRPGQHGATSYPACHPSVFFRGVPPSSSKLRLYILWPLVMLRPPPLPKSRGCLLDLKLVQMGKDRYFSSEL